MPFEKVRSHKSMFFFFLSQVHFKQMSSTNTNLDFTQVPITVLKKPTVIILSAGLNAQKIIPNEDGIPRDWRGLAHLAGLSNFETNRFSAMPDPTQAFLNHWGASGNVHMLLEFLAVIDRFDVLDDVRQVIGKLQVIWKS